jgi:hypothetical protein
VTPDVLAAIRERVEDNAEGDVMFGRDEVAALLAEVDRLRAALIAADSIMSLIRYRSPHLISDQDRADLDAAIATSRRLTS